MSAGEEVTTAVLGSMGVHVGSASDSKPGEPKEKTLKRREKKPDGKEDVDMEVVIDQLDSITKMKLERINPSQDFIRQLCGIAVAQLKDMQS